MPGFGAVKLGPLCLIKEYFKLDVPSKSSITSGIESLFAFLPSFLPVQHCQSFLSLRAPHIEAGNPYL